MLVAGCNACGNRMITNVPNGNGTLRAVLFERDCGATTGFSSQISLLGNEEALPNEAGNLFVADNNHGRAKLGRNDTLNVALRWLDPHRLEIHYDHLARVFKAERNMRGVRIVYVAN